MFRTLARLAEEHELLEALPFLRGGADDEDDLVQDAIAALPPLVARFFFAPRAGPKAPPLLGRCFTLKKLSAPHDVREACLRGAANSFRFRAEYRWSACAVGFVAGFADGSAWSASWLVAEAACVVLARAPPAVPVRVPGGVRDLRHEVLGELFWGFLGAGHLHRVLAARRAEAEQGGGRGGRRAALREAAPGHGPSPSIW